MSREPVDWSTVEEPWFRLRKLGETAKAYKAFCVYRDMGPSRTLAEAYRKHAGREEADSQPPGYFRAWYDKYGWRGRAESYDEERDRKLLAQLDQAHAEVFEVLSKTAKLHVNTLVSIAAGRRQLPPLQPGLHHVREDTQLRAALDALDRIGIKAPERVEIGGQMGLDTWIEMVDQAEKGE